MIRYIMVAWLAFVIFFGWGLSTVKYGLFPWQFISPLIEEVEAAIKGDDEGSVLNIVAAITSDFQEKPLKHMKPKSPNAEEALSSFTQMGHFPESLKDNCFKVVTSYKGNLAILLVGDKQKLLHQWNVNYDRIFGSANENNHTDINGSLLLSDGSVIVNYAPYKGIARIDVDGTVIWKNDTLATHHSVTQTMSDSIWVPGREILSEGRLGQVKGRMEDVLYEFDIETGGQIRKIYTVDIFYKNSIHGLYEWIISEDKIHVNDIEEVGIEFAEANKKLGVKGTDIIMTGKRMNFILIVDPDTLEAKYIGNHPWNQPHDTDPQVDGSFLVFDNNQSKGEPRQRWGPSRILSVRPETKETGVYFTAEWFYSATRSDQELFGNQLMISSDNNAYLFNVENGRPNFWYINEANNNENWFTADARWVSPSFFVNPEMQAKCSDDFMNDNAM